MLKAGLFLYVILLMLVPRAQGQSANGGYWSEVKAQGEGTLVVAYSENSPFIYNDAQGKLAGIEFEIMEEFVRYIDEMYGAEVNLEFEHLYDFASLIDTLKNSHRPIIGIASISSLEERKKDFKITDSYMPDIEIIISSMAFSSVSSLSDFADMVKNNRAITVTNSTFERNILELKKDYFPEIQIEYVRHVDYLIEAISNSDNAWGYVSLPNYLSYYKIGKGIVRQRFFMVENPGLSIATTMTSDWDTVLDAFIEDRRFKPLLDSLIEKHLGKAFGEVVASISNLNADLEPDIAANREVGVLMLEKEVQDLKLRQSELEIDRQNLIISLGIIVIVFVLIALFFLYRLVRLKINTNKSLSEKNEQIQAQISELNALNMEKNEMIEIVAHDLKNPLTSAMSISGLLGNEKTTEAQREYLGLIKKSLNRMNSLVSRILEIKVLESSSLKTNYSNIDLKQVTEQVITALKIQSDNKKIRIVTDLDEVTASLDRSLIVQIIDNLLSNAIKFSNHHTKVHVSLKKENRTIRLEIDDEGPGIMEEDLPKLFQKFQKLNAQPTGGESSTGLGLSIVKKYVEAMEGKVWCESEPGKGTRFIVEFKK
jgi:signal transduction histidine kinase/ABC-type amino acid transport substrate-binding protein